MRRLLQTAPIVGCLYIVFLLLDFKLYIYFVYDIINNNDCYINRNNNKSVVTMYDVLYMAYVYIIYGGCDGHSVQYSIISQNSLQSDIPITFKLLDDSVRDRFCKN